MASKEDSVKIMRGHNNLDLDQYRAHWADFHRFSDGQWEDHNVFKQAEEQSPEPHSRSSIPRYTTEQEYDKLMAHAAMVNK